MEIDVDGVLLTGFVHRGGFPWKKRVLFSLLSTLRSEGRDETVTVQHTVNRVVQERDVRGFYCPSQSL